MQLRGPELEPGEPLPITADLGALLRARIDVLPAQERQALLVASSTSRPTLALAQAAVGTSSEDLFGASEAAEIVRVHHGQVTFSHPLLASAVYQGASIEGRRAAHGRLAEIVKSDEERARHLALASTGSDAEVATALQNAAEHAYVRGATATAAELWEMALRATPIEDVERRHHRRLNAVACVFEAGDVAAARRTAREVLSETPSGEARADVLEKLAALAWNDVVEIRPLAEAAVEEAPDPSGILAAAFAPISPGWRSSAEIFVSPGSTRGVPSRSANAPMTWEPCRSPSSQRRTPDSCSDAT
jgi:hypothetical protein